MAKVRWGGAEFFAKPVRKLPNGDAIMEALQHTARTTIGTQIRVTPREIIDADAMPEASKVGQSFDTLIAALEEERKTIPSVQEVLAKFREDRAKAAQGASHGQEA